MYRRDALRLLAGAAAVAATGHTSSVEAAEPPKSKLGLVIYCLGLNRRAQQQKSPPVDLFEPVAFLEYCRSLGAGGIQVPLGIREEAYARSLGEKAQAYGMFIEGIVNPPFKDGDVDRFDAELRTARDAGALAVRTVIMPGRRYEQFDSLDAYRQAAERGAKAIERAAPVAERRRVRLAVENHKDQRVEERVKLLRAIGSEYVGACVDVGNSFSLLEDPLATVEAFAPWAFSVHLKDEAVREYDDGFLMADVALGDGFLELKKMVAVLRRARPEVRFGLESITRDPLKVPCLTEKYWATMANVGGADLARTLRTVRNHSAKELLQLGGLPFEEQVAAESRIVSRSLSYANQSLEL